MMRIAIIGAGISGLACADALRESGHKVTLFDKGRRPGGRCSTLVLDDRSWDFGAPCFTVSDPRFARQAEQWLRRGMIAPWPAAGDRAMTGVPTMSSFVATQAAAHDVTFGIQVRRLDRSSDQWFIDAEGLRAGPFDAAVLALPAEQVVALLALHDLAMVREAALARSAPCWALMVEFDRPLECLPDILMDEGGDLALAARSGSKPGRGQAECWVIHAGPDWSRAHLNDEGAAVAGELLTLFSAAASAPLPPVRFAKAHRWRFARAVGETGGPLWNPDLRLGACGDWCLGSTIEQAWLAGRALGAQIAEADAEPPSARAAFSVNA